jgi:4-alpha-glucanotransferase
MKRSSGILMHITSLPSPYGIGTFGKEAYEFIDFLHNAEQRYWQILPLGPTGYGDSPYQCFSAFAGNPYFIDFRILKDEGYLSEQDYINEDFGIDPSKVDYEKIYCKKFKILRKAYENSKYRNNEKIDLFREENKGWLEDYALYMALKNHFNLIAWQEWPYDIKLRDSQAMKYYSDMLKDEINYWIFLQYHFFKKWLDVKKYANERGIGIIGDIPMYVSEDSSDAWANGELFKLDKDKRPITVAGCPPDAFSQNGQLWGNPIYNWDYIASTGFQWWIERIKANFKLFDVIRIDHFRGFEAYWEVPYGHKTAVNGRWTKGPADTLFKAIKNELGEDVSIIAEDLGFLTDEVRAFRDAVKFPGMKVLEFAFNPYEESDYLPHNYHNNCVVYTGTHDNDTVNGWMENSGFKADVNHAVDYLKLNKEEGYNWGFIRGAWSSVAYLAIAQMQDFIGLGSEARMNTPSTLGGNWSWRVRDNQINEMLAQKIGALTRLYDRANK